MAFFLLLEVPLDAQTMRCLSPIELQGLIGSLYINYTGSPEGLASDTLETLSHVSAHKLHSPKPILSKLLCQQSQHDTPPPSDLPAQFGDDQVFYDTLCQESNLYFFVDQKYLITAAQIQQVQKPDGRLCDVILNGYLHLWAADMSKLNHTTTCKIFDTFLADRLRDTPTKPQFKPPCASKKKGKLHPQRWVPECLILPWFVPKNQHWILVAINTSSRTIRVYDSLNTQPDAHRHICECILHFLTWENHCLENNELSPEWWENLDAYLLHKVRHVVPQQPNGTDCGYYIIAFAQEFGHSLDPASGAFRVLMQQITNIRYPIIVRLSQDWVLQQAYAQHLLPNQLSEPQQTEASPPLPCSPPHLTSPLK
ncbi:cysteine proteinase [Ramaria rubella]|nr:cysteine proteinase [Ramaria rubella]